MAFARWRRDVWDSIFDSAENAHSGRRLKTAGFLYKLAIAVSGIMAAGPGDTGRAFLLLGELMLERKNYAEADNAFRNAVRLFASSPGGEVDLAIVLCDMSENLRLQDEHETAALFASMARQQGAVARRKLEKCFEIPAA